MSIQLVGSDVFDDDFARERQVSVEPRAPEATSVGQNVDLVVAEGVALAPRGNLQDRAIRVATNNLEVVDRLRAALVAGQERTNCASIASEVIAFTLVKRPLASLLNLGEPVLRQDALAVVDGVEVTG